MSKEDSTDLRQHLHQDFPVSNGKRFGVQNVTYLFLNNVKTSLKRVVNDDFAFQTRKDDTTSTEISIRRTVKNALA